MTENVIIIPSRLEATRLPNKPLKKINNKEMILHVYEAAKKANIGEVIVASPNQQIYELITSAKGICVKTRSDHKTGTDIIYEALDYVEKSLSGLLEPDIKETVLGSAEIQKIFKVSTAGKIAGSKVCLLYTSPSPRD